MITTRPLLYYSLPGLALIIGIIYLRRQKKSRKDKDNDNNHSDIEDNNMMIASSNNTMVTEKFIKMNNQTEKSASIEMTTNIKAIGNADAFEVDTINKLGKSAPIDIASGMKALSVKYIDNIILEDDYNDIKEKVNYCKSSLEKDDDDFYLSSVDLPDSPNNKKRYLTMHVNSKCLEEPIVVKATVSPNISLSNSFIESKYTEEASAGNNGNQFEQTLNPIKQTSIENIDIDKNNNDGNDNNQTITNNSSNNSKTNSKNENLSPPISEYSAHSGDSGKGSSLTQSEKIKTTNYDFLIPMSLIGRLCGHRKSFMNEIKSKSGVVIILKNHNIIINMKICSLKGTEKEINAALSILRNRFPLKRYPNVTLQKIEYAEPHTIVPLSVDYTSCLQLRLIEGINNDVIISSIISGDHIFVQHPSHLSFKSIPVLQNCLNTSYETGEAPSLPQLTDNAICVAKVLNSWFRVQIVMQYHKEQKCLIKFLDCGGYFVADNENLKQIRADFMSMPFQATECLLSNIEPTGSEWRPEVIETLYHLTAGLVLQAHIVRYNASNLPEINLYATLSKNNVIFINKELVARGFAKWIAEN